MVGLVDGRLAIGRIFTVYFPSCQLLSEIQQERSRRFPKNFPKPSTKKSRRFLVDGFDKLSGNLCHLSRRVSLGEYVGLIPNFVPNDFTILMRFPMGSRGTKKCYTYGKIEKKVRIILHLGKFITKIHN